MMKSTASLSINRLELSVSLGWSEVEREESQIVLVDIEIKFQEPLAACLSDQLDDTLCYANLINYIQSHIVGRKFRLVEHLAYDLYQLVRSQAPVNSAISVGITKHPPITGLTGGIQFTYGETR